MIHSALHEPYANLLFGNRTVLVFVRCFEVVSQSLLLASCSPRGCYYKYNSVKADAQKSENCRYDSTDHTSFGHAYPFRIHYAAFDLFEVTLTHNPGWNTCENITNG